VSSSIYNINGSYSHREHAFKYQKQLRLKDTSNMPVRNSLQRAF
jgi:hypothetical protein